jgi:hypothetical protein
LGLRVPEIVFIRLEPGFGRSEPDPEIQDLLKSSIGLNLGLRYLPAAFAFNQLLKPEPDAELASAIVWFDAYVTNVDRTDRNVNLLIWQNRLWLIVQSSGDQALITFSLLIPTLAHALRVSTTTFAFSTTSS